MIGEHIMCRYELEDIYYTLLGEMSPPYAVPGIENAYAPGGECDQYYNEAMEAYQRLRERLGVQDEDEDIEIILGNFLGIQRILCEKMFRYGQLLG
jgi:hypothetical protein